MSIVYGDYYKYDGPRSMMINVTGCSVPLCDTFLDYWQAAGFIILYHDNNGGTASYELYSRTDHLPGQEEFEKCEKKCRCKKCLISMKKKGLGK